MNKLVLIADGNAARARRLGEACAGRGLRATFAENGAAALESALVDVPAVVVAPMDLGLIDARRLAEILGANPRTQEVRFLFLSREEARIRARGVLDETLPPSSDPEEVAERVESMLAQRARMDAVERDAQGDHEVEGKLSQIPLTDLLQLFHMNRRTGTLHLKRRQPGGREEHGAVLLRDGNLVQASAGAGVEGEKALFRLLAWRDGTFAFSPNPVHVAPRILTPTRVLLMEGLRQLDEWDRLQASLPPLGARVALAVPKAELPNAVHPVTQEVLLLLELYEEVRDLVDHCSHPDYQVLRTLQTLVDRGLVELRREPDRPVPTSGTALFEPTQIRRLRDWLETGRPRGAPLPEAKLLLVSPDADATRDFVRLLAGLPGMHLTSLFQRGTFAAQDVEPVGRLVVDEGIAIQIVHVPADEAYAALWPVVSHGALGALFLMSSPVHESERRLAAVVGAMSAQPRARLFHLFLLRKGERPAREELHSKISLLDSASLFLVQLEGGKDPASRLHGLLSRVMP